MNTSPLQVLDLPSARVLALSGDVDVNVTPLLIAGLPQLVAGARAVVLDLSDVTFFDSSGVRFTDRLARTCTDLDQPWRIVAPRGSSSRRVLDLVGMSGPEVVEDRPSAVQGVD